MDREELHRRVMLLRDQVQAGKFKVMAHLADAFLEDLSAIRIADDGLVDPLTVSPRVRSSALLVSEIRYREEVKAEISTREIQELYFSLVESLFGEIMDLFNQTSTTPARFASWFTSIDEQVSKNDPIFREFLEKIDDFWDEIGDAAWIILEDDDSLKAVFGGEPFPTGDPTVGLGLYFDTVVLPDPFLRMGELLRQGGAKSRVENVIRWAIEVLRIKALALAEVEPPIVVILPDRAHFRPHYRELILASADEDTLNHLERAFGRRFGSIQEADEFLRSAKEPKEVLALVSDPSRVLFATEWDDPLEEQLGRYFEEWVKPYGLQGTLGQHLLNQIKSRMMQATDLLRRSADIEGSPIIKAETPWTWLQWKLEYRSSLHPEAHIGRLHVARTLGNADHPDLVWIGDVPPEAMIEMRQQEALPELREQISRGIQDFDSARAQDFEGTADHVAENLQAAIARHRENVRALRKKNLKFAGRDLGSFLVTGTIAIAAAASGTPLFGVLATIAGLSGGVPTAKGLKERSDNLREDRERIARSPMGILSKYVRLPRS